MMVKQGVVQNIVAHFDKIDPYSLPELADKIGDLRYDALCVLLHHLSVKLVKDGEADAVRGRKKLSACLVLASKLVNEAKMNIEEAWRISEPFMK